jgi:hypothetical protein
MTRRWRIRTTHGREATIEADSEARSPWTAAASCATCGRKGCSRGSRRARNWERFDVGAWGTLIAQHEAIQWLPIVLIALLIFYVMLRNSQRPREPVPPRRFNFGRMLLAALFLAGLAFLVKWGR